MRLHFLGIRQTLLARAGVGTAAVYGNSLRIAVLVDLAAHEHRSSAHFILRKYRTTGSRHGTENNCYIMIAAGFDTGLDAGSKEALRCSHPAFGFLHEIPLFPWCLHLFFCGSITAKHLFIV